jgi:hypothetical protein
MGCNITARAKDGKLQSLAVGGPSVGHRHFSHERYDPPYQNFLTRTLTRIKGVEHIRSSFALKAVLNRTSPML